MRVVLTLAVMAAFAAIYLIWIRPYLKSLPTFAEIYNAEATTWSAVTVWIQGRRTILIGLWGEVIAMGPDVLQIAGGVDLYRLGIPDQWAAIVGGVAVPMLMMIFRAKAG